MGKYIKGIDRGQLVLFQETIEDMIKADEVVHAGGKYHVWNSNYYLLRNAEYADPWWLLSIASSDKTFNIGFWLTGSWTGNLETSSINDELNGSYTYVRPAVTLISGVEIASGNGTLESPYAVS